jgi:hypothetical protein
MTISSTSTSTHPAGTVRWLRTGFIALALAGADGLLVIKGSQVLAALEASKAQDLDDENRAFCARYGAGAETTRFAGCAADLTSIRTSHEQRSADLFF